MSITEQSEIHNVKRLNQMNRRTNKQENRAYHEETNQSASKLSHNCHRYWDPNTKGPKSNFQR